MTAKIRYDVYGALVGVGLPLVGTLIEALHHFGSVAPAALVRAHAGQPLLWIMDTTPFVLGGLGRVIVRQHQDLLAKSGEIVRQSDEIVRLEQVRRESFDRTARELSHMAQGLLGNVAAFTATTTEAATSVRETTEAMKQLSQSATRRGAHRRDRDRPRARSRSGRAPTGLRQAETASEELLRLAEQVRGLSRRIEGLDERLRGVLEAAELVGRVSDRADEVADRAAEVAGGPASADALREIAAQVHAHAAETRGAAARVKTLLGDVQRAMAEALREAEAGSARAQTGAASRPRPASRSAGSPRRSATRPAPRRRSRAWRSSRRAPSSRCSRR